MSYFLWIEDFENSAKTTASNLFSSLVEEQYFSDNTRQLKANLKKYGIFIELNFQDGLGFIRNKLADIDYIILDIDLPAYSGEKPNDSVFNILEQWHGYKKLDDKTKDEALLADSAKNLKEIAGYYLYTELVIELGFPKEKILFCSNHGDNLQSVQDAFKAAKITLPTIYEKSDHKAHEWIVKNCENSYSRLRRGIIEGCQYLKSLDKDNLRFNNFIKDREKHYSLEDIQDYLTVLEKFLPLTLQSSNDNSTLYKLFIRTLAHEWEAAEPTSLKAPDSKRKQQEFYAFSWTMKMSRNWSAHSKVFAELAPQDVAYLFIINMRAMFNLGDKLHPYEDHLLQLFAPPIIKDKMKRLIGKSHTDRKIPFIENYANLLSTSGNTYQAMNFHDILNRLQKNNKLTDNYFFMKGIYQMFWFLTSSGQVFIPYDKERVKTFSVLKYQFKHFDYTQEEYLFEIGRHIYKSSFPEV